MENLSAIVRGNEAETLLRNARLTRAWPDSQQKSQEANRQVRMAMYKAAFGQVSGEERDRILEILHPCCPELFAAVLPLPEHGWELPIVLE